MFKKKLAFFAIFSVAFFGYSQYKTIIDANVDTVSKKIAVTQTIAYTNASTQVLDYIILNDWNNAYSSKNSPLAKKMANEYVRSFHYADYQDKGFTENLQILDNGFSVCRLENQLDLLKVNLPEKLLPNQTVTFKLQYTLKIPNDKFTRYGFNQNNEMNLKNCFITPAKYIDNQGFLLYSNYAIDDAFLALGSVYLTLHIPEKQSVTTNLELISKENNAYLFSGKNIQNLSVSIENNNTFQEFVGKNYAILCNFKIKKVNTIQQAILVDKVAQFVQENLGSPVNNLEVISQKEYDANAFYGLNMLPAFLSPFTNETIYEMQFLKTYLNSYLKNNLQIDNRKNYWISDALEIYLISKYVSENYPDLKMTGSIAKIKFINSYHLINLYFNEQFNYFYMVTARKNLDQAFSESKPNLIKYNEKIGSKYHAGVNLSYLDQFLGGTTVTKSILELSEKAKKTTITEANFKEILETNSGKKLDWFFGDLLSTRKTIDYTLKEINQDKATATYQILDKTNTNAPISVYTFKDKKLIEKQWIENPKIDSLLVFDKTKVDRVALNYTNEIPEFNRRNNYYNLHSKLFNKPLKLKLFKDLEDPKYNQILVQPTFGYNYYDGLVAGLSFYNATMLDRFFNYDITPSYATKSGTLTGSFSVNFKKYNRESTWFSTRYGISGSTYHYAPDASYQKINPWILFRIREPNMRENHLKSLMFREVYLNREQSRVIKNDFVGNYAIFNARYSDLKTDITHHFGYSTDLQIAGKFSKVSGEISYRKLFNYRQINIRGFFGTFIYNNTNNPYFDFALDRPTDYLFDLNYLGRSESTGLWSQQYIAAEGAFKSKIPNQLSNQWLATVNASTNIWNWIEVYGDVGLMKSKGINERFVYDSGIRLNLVTDYFELYLPVYSNNGWEIAQPKYAEKIRFIIAFSPKALTGLFTRKWF